MISFVQVLIDLILSTIVTENNYMITKAKYNKHHSFSSF